MRHLRRDYDGIQDASGKIPADEPVFVLRAQDVTAGEVVRFWSLKAEEAGADPAMVEAVRSWALEMEVWAHEHGVTKVPDVDPEHIRPIGEWREGT